MGKKTFYLFIEEHLCNLAYTPNHLSDKYNNRTFIRVFLEEKDLKKYLNYYEDEYPRLFNTNNINELINTEIPSRKFDDYHIDYPSIIRLSKLTVQASNSLEAYLMLEVELKNKYSINKNYNFTEIFSGRDKEDGIIYSCLIDECKGAKTKS